MPWYQGFCPLGAACSKGGKQIACKQSKEDVIEAIAWHLNQSTYHQVPYEEAFEMARNEEYINELGEDGEDSGGTKPDWKEQLHQQSQWLESTSKASGSGTAASPAKVASPILEQVALRATSRSRSPRVSIRAGEVQQISDALNRAIYASEHAAKISRSAAQAFEDQAATLSGCKRLMENIVASNIR